MALNGTDFIHDMWNTTFNPYTNMFLRTMGNGNIFYLVPFIVLTIGIYIKTKDATVATLFMIATGAVCSTGSMFSKAPDIAMIFLLFAAMGFVGLFTSLFFHK